MGQAAYQSNYVSYEEYLDIEAHSEVRHEYINGELFAKTGTTKKHNRIAFNINKACDNQLPAACGSYQESVKVELSSKKDYRYPDVVLTCDESEDDSLTIKKPVVIFEVASDSTSDYDRVGKFGAYRKYLPMLQHYVLVQQKQLLVECYTRDVHFWQYRAYDKLSDVLELPAVDVKISLEDIYSRVAFADQSDSTAPQSDLK